jgi:hypothetical protein
LTPSEPIPPLDFVVRPEWVSFDGQRDTALVARRVPTRTSGSRQFGAFVVLWSAVDRMRDGKWRAFELIGDGFERTAVFLGVYDPDALAWGQMRPSGISFAWS